MKLVIEIDGSAHDGQKNYDAGRDAWLLRVYGVRTIRIKNSQVMGLGKVVVGEIGLL